MDSMLIVLEPPDGTTQNAVSQWDALLQRLRDRATQIEGIEMFAENAWQIPLKDGLPVLAELILGADAARIRYNVLFFEKTPEWIRSATAP